MQLSKLCLATKKFLSAMVITTTVLSTTPIQKINLKGSEINVSAATETKISNPRIMKHYFYQIKFWTLRNMTHGIKLHGRKV